MKNLRSKKHEFLSLKLALLAAGGFMIVFILEGSFLDTNIPPHYLSLLQAIFVFIWGLSGLVAYIRGEAYRRGYGMVKSQWGKFIGLFWCLMCWATSFFWFLEFVNNS